MNDAPLITFHDIVKRYPGIVALKGIHLTVSRGSCHALVGENGAGKSTLGKILAGIEIPDAGHIEIENRRCRFTGPRDALGAGIAMVHQELLFCENLSVAENLCLGSLPRRGVFVSQSLFDLAKKKLEPFQVEIDVRRRLGELTIGEQQIVQIAAAIASGARILIFDEPTSSLSAVDADRLFHLIKRLEQTNVTCLYVSHRMEEIFRLCDRVSVLRDGELIGTFAVDSLDEGKLVQMMIGRQFTRYFPAHLDEKPGSVRLRVKALSSPGRFSDVSFAVREREIVGLAGLVGAGRTQVAEAVVGLDLHATGRILIDEAEVSIRNPAEALRAGVALVPEDRKRFGLVLSMSAKENITLPMLGEMSRLGWIQRCKENELAETYYKLLAIKARGLSTPARNLSGGNQQKLVVARWLAARARILFIDEPTRGVDVGAKAEIHNLIDQLARSGTAIVLISSELPEIINLSTRVIVMRGGRIAGELARTEANQDAILRLMTGLVK